MHIVINNVVFNYFFKIILKCLFMYYVIRNLHKSYNLPEKMQQLLNTQKTFLRVN